MQFKNIILESFKTSFISIWKNKSLFAFLFILQIIFFTLFSFVNYHYQTKMVESSQAIYEYMNKLQFDETKISQNILEQKSILGDDPLMLSRNFNDIIKNFRIYALYVFILLVVFSSIFWTLANRFFNKISAKQLKEVFFRNFAVLSFYLGLMFLFFFSLLNISIMQLTAEASKIFTKYLVFLIISAALSYFMFISLSLTGATELKNIVQKTLSVGVKKARYILAVYIADIILFGASAFLLHYFLERNQFVLFASLALLVFSFVFGRIFMVNVVGKLD